jgi:Protein of unknown function (DUF2690)
MLSFRRGGRLAALAALAAALAGQMAASPASAAVPGPRLHDFENPQGSTCAADGKVVRSARVGAGTLELVHSLKCGTVWGTLTFPASAYVPNSDFDGIYLLRSDGATAGGQGHPAWQVMSPATGIREWTPMLDDTRLLTAAIAMFGPSDIDAFTRPY